MCGFGSGRILAATLAVLLLMLPIALASPASRHAVTAKCTTLSVTGAGVYNWWGCTPTNATGGRATTTGIKATKGTKGSALFTWGKGHGTTTAGGVSAKSLGRAKCPKDFVATEITAR